MLTGGPRLSDATAIQGKAGDRHHAVQCAAHSQSLVGRPRGKNGKGNGSAAAAGCSPTLSLVFQKQFLAIRPSAKRMDPGDLTERLRIKEKLGCKPFNWFIENVEPNLKPRHDEL
jgi:hypothetical protein